MGNGSPDAAYLARSARWLTGNGLTGTRRGVRRVRMWGMCHG